MASTFSSNYLVDKEPTASRYIPIFQLDITFLLLFKEKKNVGEEYSVLSTIKLTTGM